MNRRPGQFTCGYKSPTLTCGYVCTTYKAMAIHVETAHCCGSCGGYYDEASLHRPTCIQRGTGRGLAAVGSVDIRPFKEIRHSLKGTLRLFSAPVQPPTECQVASVFENLSYPIKKLLTAVISHYNGVKVNFTLIADLIEVTHDVIHLGDPIGSPFMPISHPDFIPRIVTNSCVFIISALNLYLENGSNWQLLRLRALQIAVGEWSPVIRGRGYIPIPKALAGRRGLLSIKTKTNCFQLSLLCALYEDEILQKGMAKRHCLGRKVIQKSKAEKSILEKEESYESFLERLDLSFLTGPDVSILQIDLVEEKFPDLSVTVYGNTGSDIVLLRAPKEERVNQVNLLLIKAEKREDYHFVCIRDISALLGKRNVARHHVCPVCQKRFDARTWSNVNHECGESSTQVKTPWYPYVKFRQFDALLKAPYFFVYKIFYLSVPSDQMIGDECISVTEKVSCGFSLLCVGSDGETVERHSYIGEDALEKFLETSMELAKSKLDEVKFTNNFLQPSEEEETLYKEATHCEVCGNMFDNNFMLKTYHHDHFTGKKMQTCCTSCNLQIKPTNRIMAITFGERNEFNHMLKRVKPQHGTPAPIRRKEGVTIGIDLKKTLRKSKYNIHYGIRFVDLKNFRADSILSELVEELEKSERELPVFELVSGKKNKPNPILTTNEEILIQFPSVEYFFQNKTENFLSFTDENVSSQVPESWKQLSLENFVRHKLNGEAALIADVFRATRNEYWNEFSLDLCSFWSVSSFARESAYLWEKCKIEVVTDPKMANFISRGTIGPVVQVTRLKSIANNSQFSDFDPHIPSKIIFYADINSCYSECLLGNLPTGNYEWLSMEELLQFDFKNPNFDDGYGYLFEVDIDYESDEVRDFLSELPFPQEKRSVTVEMLSPFQRQFLKEKINIRHERVLSTLYKKERQVYYGKLLKFMVDHGVIITQFYSAIRFRESPIFHAFASNNVSARNSAKFPLQKQLRKLLNNSLYGQMLKNNAEYSRSKLVRTSVDAKAELNKNTFKSFEILDEETALFDFSRGAVTDYNLRMVGLVILSNAKILLYSHYYDGLKKHFGDKCHHLSSSTDSIIAEITCTREEYIKRLKEMSHRFDFSNMEGELYDCSKAGTPGLLKIQSDGIREFFSTGCNQYSLEIDPAYRKTGILKAGGIPKKQACQLRHEDFKKVVENGEALEKVKVASVKILDDQLLVVASSRSSLCPGITAGRYFVSNTISFPFGDRRIKDF